MGFLSWKRVAVLGLLMLLLHTFVACGASKDAADDGPFRIGFMESVTGLRRDLRQRCRSVQTDGHG